MMKKKRMLLAVAVLLAGALLGGCFLLESAGREKNTEDESTGPEGNWGFPVTVEGALIRDYPERVVSLSPSLTEKLGDLLLQDRLVGVSDFCDYPSQVGDLPGCGTALLPDIEEIARLEADLVLAEGELPAAARAALEEREIDVLVLSRPGDVAAWKESYRSLALALEGAEDGEELAAEQLAEIEERLAELERYGAHARANGEKTVLYLRMLHFVAATGDTIEQELMEVVGLKNIAEPYRNWLITREQADSEEAKAAFAGLDIIYCDDEAEDGVTIADLEASEYYRSLEAVVRDRYLYIDSEAFERQGMRMLDQVEAMGMYAYPEVRGGEGAQASPDGAPEEAPAGAEEEAE